MIGEWNLGAQSEENITNLLNKENLTIEDILDEENILSDLRLSSKKFGSFMISNPEYIKKMINYIIQEPDITSQNVKFFHKFPFNSSEIFLLELEDIINAFFIEIPSSHIANNLANNTNIGINGGEENPEMMEKCIGYSMNYDMLSSPKKGIKKEEKDDDMAMMDRKFSPFKPIENHFDLFKHSSFQSITTSETSQNFELLDHLFSFLENSEKKLNLTSAGYFAKVIHALMNKRFMDLTAYLELHPIIIQNMIKNCANLSICEIISRLIRADKPFSNEDYFNQDTYFSNLRKQLLKDLVEKFQITQNQEEMSNICNVICEFITKNKRINGGRELLENMVNAFLKKFFENITKTNIIENSHFICCSATVIVTLLDLYLNKEAQVLEFVNLSKSIEMDDNFEAASINELKEVNIKNSPTIHYLETYLPDIIKILKRENLLNRIETTFGKEILVFGPGKLKILDIINLSLNFIDDTKILQIITEESMALILFKLLKEFEWNTFLHNKIQQFFFVVLEKGGDIFRKNLFEKSMILENIIELMNNEDFIMPLPHNRKIKRGYRGCLTNISNKIIEIAEKDTKIMEILQSKISWNEYLSKDLKPSNEKNNTLLGDFDPKILKQSNSKESKNEKNDGNVTLKEEVLNDEKFHDKLKITTTTTEVDDKSKKINAD